MSINQLVRIDKSKRTYGVNSSVFRTNTKVLPIREIRSASARPLFSQCTYSNWTRSLSVLLIRDQQVRGCSPANLGRSPSGLSVAPENRRCVRRPLVLLRMSKRGDIAILAGYSVLRTECGVSHRLIAASKVPLNFHVLLCTSIPLGDYQGSKHLGNLESGRLGDYSHTKNRKIERPATFKH